MAPRMADTWRALSHFSAGSKDSHLLRYTARAVQQSARDVSVHGLRFNPAARRLILYQIEGETCIMLWEA
jgi:hypothetical protein